MEELDLNELGYVLWKKKGLIILITVIIAMIGFVYAKFLIKPVYESSTSLVLSKSGTDTTGTNKQPVQSDSITQSDVLLNQKLVTTYSEIIKSRNIAKQVIQKLNLTMTEDEFIKNVVVSSKADTELLEITVTNHSPELAAQIANTLAEVFTAKVKEVYNISNVSIIDKGEVNGVPINKNIVKSIGIFGISGFCLACFFIFIRVYFNTTIKNQDEVEKITGLPVIAVIPKHE